MVKSRKLFEKVRSKSTVPSKTMAEQREDRIRDRHRQFIPKNKLGDTILPYILKSNIKDELDVLEADDTYTPDVIDNVPSMHEVIKSTRYLEEPVVSELQQRTKRNRELLRYSSIEKDVKSDGRLPKSRKPVHFSQHLGLEEYLDEETVRKKYENDVAYSHVDSFDSHFDNTNVDEPWQTERSIFSGTQSTLSFGKDDSDLGSDLEYKMKDGVISVEKKKTQTKTTSSSNGDFRFSEFDDSDLDSDSDNYEGYEKEMKMLGLTKEDMPSKKHKLRKKISPKAIGNFSKNSEQDISDDETPSGDSQFGDDDDGDDDEDDFVPYSSNLYEPIDKIIEKEKKRYKSTKTSERHNMIHDQSGKDLDSDDTIINDLQLSNKKRIKLKAEKKKNPMLRNKNNNNVLTEQLQKNKNPYEFSYEEEYEYETNDNYKLPELDLEKAMKNKYSNEGRTFEWTSEYTDVNLHSVKTSKGKQLNEFKEKQLLLNKANKLKDYDINDYIKKLEAQKWENEYPSSSSKYSGFTPYIPSYDSSYEDIETGSRKVKESNLKSSIKRPAAIGRFQNFSDRNSNFNFNYNEALESAKRNRNKNYSNKHDLSECESSSDDSDLEKEIEMAVEKRKKEQASKKPTKHLRATNAVRSDEKYRTYSNKQSFQPPMDVVKPNKKKIKKIPKPIPELEIVERHEWFDGFPLSIKPLQTPVPNVVEDYNTDVDRCFSKHDCKERLREIQKRAMEEGKRDLPYSFLIGDDGRVYEGRGWDTMVTDKFNWKGIVVAYIGRFSTEHPPNLQLDQAYRRLIGLGRENKYIRFRFNHTFVNRDGIRALELEC